MEKVEWSTPYETDGMEKWGDTCPYCAHFIHKNSDPRWKIFPCFNRPEAVPCGHYSKKDKCWSLFNNADFLLFVSETLDAET